MHSILTEIPDIRVFGFSLRDYLGEANANGGTATPKRPETKRWSLFDEYARSQNGAGVGSGAGPVNESTRDGGWQLLERRIETKLALADDHYQRFVQKHIDPLLGRSRHAELQSMLANETAVLQPAERYANRRLGLGLTALGLSILGVFVFTPLIPLAILVGLAASSAKYPLAYRQWKETKRVGAIHLICVYSLYLWLGGYATVGALGAVLYGLMLKARAVGEDQSRTNLISMFQLEPDKVWVRSDGNEIEIPFKQVLIGDILVLRAGQIVPVDGTIVAGVATVDQHMLTGEAQPVERKPGDGLLAATLIVSGQVDVAVEKTSSETTAGKIAEVLNRTMNNAKPASISAVEAADKLALPTLALSVIGWPFVGTAGAVSLMGANTTTASYLSGSLAMLNFVNIAARNGVLVKDAQALEQLSIVDTILFDKTGTLTLERPHVVAIHALNNADPKRIIMLAAAAEARQTHPIALAILDEAKELNLRLPAIDDAHYEVGYGIKVRLVESPVIGDSASKLVRVGSGRFMEMEGIELPELVHEIGRAHV